MDPRPRVLVADDDAASRASLARILAAEGFDVEETAAGDAAIEAARRAGPALMFVDALMPLVGGHEVCRRLKGDPATARIPVVLMAEARGKEDIVEAIRSGADDLLVKPVTAEAVIRKLRTLVKPASKSETERRVAARRPARWYVSWAPRDGGPAPLYKGLVHDISVKGFAFEFDRCADCTGYEEGTVHPKCLFAPMARRFAPESQVVEFLLSVSPEIILDVRGQVVHVRQRDEHPKTEKVGVTFVELPPHAAAVIRSYVEGTLKM